MFFFCSAYVLQLLIRAIPLKNTWGGGTPTISDPPMIFFHVNPQFLHLDPLPHDCLIGEQRSTPSPLCIFKWNSPNVESTHHRTRRGSFSGLNMIHAISEIGFLHFTR